MMIDDIEIEKKIKKLKDNYANNKKSSKKTFIKDYRVWTQKTKVYISNIVYDIKRDVKIIEKAKLLLNEIEDINSDNKKQIEVKRKAMEEKPIKVYKGITSDKYSTLLKKAYNKINQMKEESKELQKYNGLSLQNISSQYFRTSRPKSAITPKQKIFQKRRPASASTCYDSKMINRNNNNNNNNNNNSNNKLKYKTINSTYRSFRDGIKVKRQKLRLNKNNDEKKLMDLRYLNLNKIYKENNKRAVNLGRLNDIYRVQLNKALGMYSPIRHLKDMKQIQIEDVGVRREIFDINNQIDERVNERCQGLYFKREYEKYMLKNKKNLPKSNSCNIMNNSYNKSKTPIGSFRLRANYSSRNLYDPRIPNIFQENLDKEKKRKITQKEKMEKKKESLKEILGKLGETLDIEPIHNYINEESKINRKKLIKKDFIEMQKEYFPKLDEVNQDIKEVIGDEKEKMSKEQLEECIINSEETLSKELVRTNFPKKYDT